MDEMRHAPPKAGVADIAPEPVDVEPPSLRGGRAA
jgi:hypothetical protein